jgi:hypothetical protein
MIILIMGIMSSLRVGLKVLTLDLCHKFMELLGEGVQALVEGFHVLVHVLKHFGYLHFQLVHILSLITHN